MNLVVAVDKNWAIGKSGQLLIHNKYDLKHFQAITTGNTILYGRKTLETFPGGRPLKDRVNLILSRKKSLTIDGKKYSGDKDPSVKILNDCDNLAKYGDDNLYLIGGASVYGQLYQKCKYAFVTHFEFTAENPDAFFPNLADMPNWEVVEESPTVEYDGVKLRFVTYRNKDFFPDQDVD